MNIQGLVLRRSRALVENYNACVYLTRVCARVIMLACTNAKSAFYSTQEKKSTAFLEKLSFLQHFANFNFIKPNAWLVRNLLLLKFRNRLFLLYPKRVQISKSLVA